MGWHKPFTLRSKDQPFDLSGRTYRLGYVGGGALSLILAPDDPEGACVDHLVLSHSPLPLPPLCPCSRSRRCAGRQWSSQNLYQCAQRASCPSQNLFCKNLVNHTWVSCPPKCKDGNSCCRPTACTAQVLLCTTQVLLPIQVAKTLYRIIPSDSQFTWIGIRLQCFRQLLSTAGLSLRPLLHGPMVHVPNSQSSTTGRTCT